MYRRVHFDICGICNARCPWCVTGRTRSKGAGILSLETFTRAVEVMLERGILSPDGCVYLYNWGEPLLHPNLREIIAFVRDAGLRCALSTNASKAVLFDEPASLVHLDYMCFSISGFSQASYDRIHGLDFETVRENIRRIVENYRQCGFAGVAQIIFHLYRFNLDEVAPAVAFARDLGIHLLPHAAYLAGYHMMKDYLTGRMPPDELKHAEEDLLLSHLHQSAASVPADYVCPQYDFLSLDEYCNVLTCCALDRSHEHYTIGSLFDLSPDEIDHRRRAQPVCRECLDLGISTLFHNPLTAEEVAVRYK